VRGRATFCVPDFCPVFNHDEVSGFLARVPGPWVLKPRSSASAIGIRKIHSADEIWPILHELGDLQSHYLLEKFVAGEVCHVDWIVHDRSGPLCGRQSSMVRRR
jgi:glutathione synthase/RimK-type ligase-like ATP-grasp enzyme